jgi:hypothetical protein
MILPHSSESYHSSGTDHRSETQLHTFCTFESVKSCTLVICNRRQVPCMGKGIVLIVLN